MKALGCCDMVIAACFWFLMAINLIRVYGGVKPGQRMPWSYQGMVIFETSRLTENGLSTRRYFLIGLLGFLSCFVVADMLNWFNGGPVLK